MLSHEEALRDDDSMMEWARDYALAIGAEIGLHDAC